jgi:solute carrier family 50 protein (sugar transporter)
LQKRVIGTKSVEFMPFYLSLFSFLSSALWMIYGLLGRDFFIAVSTSSGSDQVHVHG